MSPVGDLIESFGISYHQFADDTQLLVAMKVDDATPALERLANCSAALVPAERSATQRGQVGGRHPWHSTLAQIGCHYLSRQQAAGHTQAEVARCNNNIDTGLRLDCHAKNVAMACNYHTGALRHVRSLLSDDLAQTVACSIVAGTSVDYRPVTAK